MTPRPIAAEPLFNVPGPVLAPVLAIVAAILLPYLLQTLAPDPDAVVAALGLSPAGVAHGRLWTLATVMVVHGGWAHALLNAAGALVFATPVTRWLGRRGPMRVFALYLACGVTASLGYVLLHWGQAEVLVGASGAIAGLMGASSRLMEDRGRLAPFRSRTVLGMAAAWVVINLLMALRWIDVGAGGAPVAWEAHLVGYAAGLLLIGPFTSRGENAVSRASTHL